MNSLSHFPLKSGGRPAMGGRRWLHRLHLHHASRQEGWGVSAMEGVAAAMVLRAMAQCLREQPDLDTSTFLRQGWEDLPLMLQPAMVQNWERQKPWMGWNLYGAWTSSYQAILEGPSPSDAYVPHESTDHVVRQVWEAYLKEVPLEDLCLLLDESAEDWLDWAMRHPQAGQLQTALKDLQEVFGKLGVPSEQAVVLSAIETFWMGLRLHFPLSGELILNVVGDDVARLLKITAAAVVAPPEAVFEIFASNSKALVLGLYQNPYQNSWKEDRIRGLDRLEALHHKRWGSVLKRWAGTGVMEWLQHENSSLPPPSFEDEAAAKERWAFLDGQFEEAVAAMRGVKPVSILVMGEHGHGKTQLCRDLVRLSGRQGFLASVRSSAENNLEEMQEAAWNAQVARSGVVIVDNSAGMFDSSHMGNWLSRASGRVSILATAVTLTTFNSQAREHFDKVIWLDAMPLEARLNLARKVFPNEELALRVARSLKTPKAIVDAGVWCKKTGSWAWSTIKAHRMASERAAQRTGWNANKPEFEVEQPLRPEDLPPMAGNEHLQDLANRLTIAFENPDKFARMGATPPKGAVLVGPPGTGKTLFARHLAARLQVPLLTPDPAKMFESPERIAVMFQVARDNAPCVILLDEAEKLICKPSIFGSIPSALGSLLTEIEGISSLEGVMVIATTNNPNIYPALLRSGRLSECREVLNPLQKDREAMWFAYLQGRPIKDNGKSLQDWVAVLSKASRGFTGADIAEVLRRAAGDAVAAGKEEMELSGLVRACDNVRWSAPNGRDSISEKERRMVAVHEAGHALMAWRWGLDVLRITVRSRQDTLGMVQWMPPEQTNDQSRRCLFGKTQMLLGGIAAEQGLFGEYEWGGSSDLAGVRRLLEFGFARAGLGSMGPTAASESLDKWPESLRQQLEEEIRAWSRAAFDEAVAWMEANREVVERLAEALLQNGDLSGEELVEHQLAAERLAQLPAIPDPLPWGASVVARHALLATPASEADGAPTLHKKNDASGGMEG